MNIIKTNKTKVLKGLAYGVIAGVSAVALLIVVAGKLGTEETVVEDAELNDGEIVDIETNVEE